MKFFQLSQKKQNGAKYCSVTRVTYESPRKGKKKAIVAVARKLSVIIYHMLKKGEK